MEDFLMRDKNSFRQRYKYWKETGELPYSGGLKRDLSNQAQSEEAPVKSGILPGYDGGRDGMFIKYVDSYRVNPETGGVYDKVGDIKEGAVILPEVEVTARKPEFMRMQDEMNRMRSIQSRQGLSGSDPLGQFVVEGVALNPVFKALGTAGLYTLGRYGESLTGFARPQNWARGKLIAREIDDALSWSMEHSPIIKTYKSNLRYKDTGSLLDYQDYINSIFPNSTISNVVYHTTYSKPFEQFDPNKIKRGFGFYFSPSEHSLPFGRNIYAKVNIKNPLEINKNTNSTLSVDGLSGFGPSASKRVLATRNALSSGKYDGIVGITNMRNPGEPEIVALDPNQIHILGSSRDLVGFKMATLKPKVGTRVGDVERVSTESPTTIGWNDALKPITAQDVFPNQSGTNWLRQTANRLGINVNHYYNNLITPEELRASVKNAGFESFVSEKDFVRPSYIPAGFPYGLKKSRILMPYDEIRKMPIMAPYTNSSDVEFRKIADDLIGSHEFTHWYNRQLAKNINSGRMKAPAGYQNYELTWNGGSVPPGIDDNALGDMIGYMEKSNGTEFNARTGQLFNAFGIQKGQFVPQHINLAKKFYRQVYPDNQMSLFLNSISDKNSFAQWANKNAGTLFNTVPTGIIGYKFYNE